METDKKLSIKIIRKIVFVCIILISLFTVGVFASRSNLTDVTIVFADDTEISVMTSNVKVSDILDENHILLLPDEVVEPNLDSNIDIARKIIISKAKDEKTGMYKSEMLKIEDRWILNKLDNLIETVTKNIEDYDLGIALDNIYSFIWNEFCDWYIEMVKPRLYSENKDEKIAVSFVLNYVFGDSLKLLHPFMPFVTSEIYDCLVNYTDEDLMMTHFPKIKKRVEYNESDNIVEKLKEMIVGIRNVRANMNIHPSKKAKLIFVTTKYKNEVNEAKEFLLKLGFGSEIKIQNNKEGIGQDAISIIQDDIELYMPLEDLVDIKEEIARLEGEKKKLEAEVQRGEKMLSNPGFVNKAPEKKINEEKEKLANYKKMLEAVTERLEGLK